jgi:hypothetical protein
MHHRKSNAPRLRSHPGSVNRVGVFSSTSACILREDTGRPIGSCKGKDPSVKSWFLSFKWSLVLLILPLASFANIGSPTHGTGGIGSNSCQLTFGEKFAYHQDLPIQSRSDLILVFEIPGITDQVMMLDYSSRSIYRYSQKTKKKEDLTLGAPKSFTMNVRSIFNVRSQFLKFWRESILPLDAHHILLRENNGQISVWNIDTYTLLFRDIFEVPHPYKTQISSSQDHESVYVFERDKLQIQRIDWRSGNPAVKIRLQHMSHSSANPTWSQLMAQSSGMDFFHIPPHSKVGYFSIKNTREIYKVDLKTGATKLAWSEYLHFGGYPVGSSRTFAVLKNLSPSLPEKIVLAAVYIDDADQQAKLFFRWIDLGSNVKVHDLPMLAPSIEAIIFFATEKPSLVLSEDGSFMYLPSDLGIATYSTSNGKLIHDNPLQLPTPGLRQPFRLQKMSGPRIFVWDGQPGNNGIAIIDHLSLKLYQ